MQGAAGGIGITLQRLALNATVQAVNAVVAANLTGAPGFIDLVWINGDNHATLAAAGCAAPRRRLSALRAD